MAGRA